MRRHARGLALLLVLLAPRALRCQTTDSSAFVAVRADGNGLPALNTTVRMGFTDQTAAGALTAIARAARLNITFDPLLPNLRTRITVPASERSAAVALMEVGRRAALGVSVSARGQIVVAATSAADVPRAAAVEHPRDSVQALATLRIGTTPIEHQVFATSSSGSFLVLSRAALRAVPTFVEPDLLRSIKTMPGIAARSDWTAAFNVRGGEADQSLILLDGYPIYNPFHVGGVFSTFMEPMVGQVNLHSGALPARFGGRLSGVLDVRSATAETAELQGSTQVSLLSATTSLGRTFAGGSGEWMLGARRTYADAVVGVVSSSEFPYHFHDVQGHISANIAGDLRLSGTGYAGSDVLAGKNVNMGSGRWGNRLLGVTLSKKLGNAAAYGRDAADSTTIEQQFSTTAFEGRIGFPNQGARATNSVIDVRIGGRIARYRATSTYTIGYELARQHLSYAATVPNADLGDVLPIDSLDARSRALSLYANHQWRPWTALLVDLGGRWESVARTTGTGFSPRIALKYFVRDDLALTAGAGRYTQWLHSLGREESPIQPLQFWVGSDRPQQASRAVDAVVGAEHWMTRRRLMHMGAFYKRYDHVKVPNEYSDPRVADDAFLAVGGSSYGVDLLVRELEGGPFSGWLSYSWARSTRVDAHGQRYAPAQDRRHNLNVVGSWRRNTNTLSVHAQLASGTPYTPVIGNFARDVYVTANGRWIVQGQSRQLLVGPSNTARLPMYRRIDVSVARDGRMFGRAASGFLSIVNVLNMKNPAGYIYLFDATADRASFPNLPFLPTIGVTIAY